MARERISDLLATEDADVLFLSGCVPNQSKFYSRFDHIVLLRASPELMVQRLTSRTNNPYGKSTEDVAEVLHFKSTIKPRLRRVATDEIDTGVSLGEVLAKILEIAGF